MDQMTVRIFRYTSIYILFHFHFHISFKYNLLNSKVRINVSFFISRLTMEKNDQLGLFSLEWGPSGMAWDET